MRYVYLLFFLLVSFPAYCQKETIVSADINYLAPDNITPEQAKRNAIRRARMQAMENAFGTKITQHNTTNIVNSNEESNVKFHSISESEVRGEWLETIKESVETKYIDGQFIYNVKVKGRARQIKVSEIEFYSRLLRNGFDDKSESTTFMNGDNIFLEFKSPEDGYVVIYLYDEKEDKVYCLLPYKEYGHGSYQIRHDKPYIFFSSKHEVENPKCVDEYILTCQDEYEYSTVFVMFSTHYLCKANAEDIDDFLPRVLSYNDFQKWLIRQRNKDATFTCKQINLTISK